MPALVAGKSPKSPFTKKECEEWFTKPTINPRTKRPINPSAPKGIYKDLEFQCKKYGIATESKTKTPSPKIKSKSPKTTKSKSPSSENKTPQEKYCRCLMHVRSKLHAKKQADIRPYAICTKSVVHKYKIPQPRFCDYDFKEFTIDELKAYAIEKKIDLASHAKQYNKSNKLTKSQLVSILVDYQASKQAKYNNK